MRLTRFHSAALAFALLASVPMHPQDKGNWRAISKTARSITGDLAFSGSKLYINFAGFTVAQLRAVTPAEAAAVFGTTAQPEGTGTLYTLSIPAEKQFLHHNTMCGSDAAQYLVTWVAGKDLQAAFFSGAAMPRLTPEAIADSTKLCGTYAYTR